MFELRLQIKMGRYVFPKNTSTKRTIRQNTSAIDKVRFAACECPAEESRALRPVLGTGHFHRVQVKARSLFCIRNKHTEDKRNFSQGLCGFQCTGMDLLSLPECLLNGILGSSQASSLC